MATAAPIIEEESANAEVETEVHIPRYFNDISPEEELTRTVMIKNIKEFKGEAIAPNDDFANNWIVMETELREIMDAGLVPKDCIASTGLDNESYINFQMCADMLQSFLYEGENLKAFGNLRGFRRLFSESPDGVLRHAFRGPPLEVLKNIYFGGNGVLPEDRMLLADPFHYEKIGKVGDDDDDD